MNKSVKGIAQFVEQARSMNVQAKSLCIDILGSDEFPSHSIDFDINEADAPSFNSYSFCAEPTDSYITSIYVRDNNLYADLYAYYTGDIRNGILLKDEPDVNYVDLLEFINSYRDNTNNNGCHLMIDTSYGEVMVVKDNDYCVAYIGDNYDNEIGWFRADINDIDNVKSSVESLLNNNNC